MTKDEIAKALKAEGRCTLTMARSSHGVITLQFQTHTLGRIDIELDSKSFTDFIFGIASVDCSLVRAIPARVPCGYKLGEPPRIDPDAISRLDEELSEPEPNLDGFSYIINQPLDFPPPIEPGSPEDTRKHLHPSDR